MRRRWGPTTFSTLGLLMVVSTAQRFDDSVLFDLEYKSIPVEGKNEDLLKVDQAAPRETLEIRTRNGENYSCHIPYVPDASQRKKITSYNGPSPAELLTPIYTEKICSLKGDFYWIYEICHGRYVLQFHEEREMTSIKRTEFFLGNYHEDYATKAASLKFDHLNPPTRVIDEIPTPYFPVTYTKGTACDITGKPRTTTVLYICDEAGQENIHSLAEVSSCHYEAIVLTSRLCSHPSFAPPAKSNYQLVCYDQEGRKDPRPLALLQSGDMRSLEAESRKAAEARASLTAEEEMIAESLNQAYQELEKRRFDSVATKNRDVQHQIITQGRGKANPERTEIDEHKVNAQIASDTISKIFSGKECIQGGAGWWKYEFCYGSTVTQFHITQDGQKQSILLGTFDEEIHKAWIDENPKKAPLKNAGKIIQVSNIYVRGDLCDESRVHRSVEVKLRCKAVEGSKLAIGLALEEPSVCQYILTLESARFCPILEEADEYGLIDAEDLAQRMSTDPVKQLKLKAGIVKRLVKDHASYHKEVAKEQERVAKIEADPSQEEFEYKLRKAKEVLQESQGMIGDTKRRLANAVSDLKNVIESGGFADDLPELVEANGHLQDAAALA
ncbi:unnamed protein product, partial [Mesorhabditis spiculigera]